VILRKEKKGMTYLTHLVLCSTILFSSNFGQEGKTTSPQQSKERPKVEDIEEGVPSTPRSTKKVGQAEIEYLENETIATVLLPDVYRQGNNLISLRATAIVTSRQLTKPDSIQLIIYFPADFAPIKGNPDLTIRYDNGQESSGATRRNSQAMVNAHRSYAGLLRFVDYGSFKRMAESKRVELQLGEFKFALNEKQLGALRDLLSAIEQ
jgi:hypothetical protein